MIVTYRVRVTTRNRRWLAGVVALLALSSMVACTQSNTVTLGATLQLTGSMAGTGRHYRDAYEFAAEKINEAGGVAIGDIRYRLALEILDNQSDPSLASRQQVDLVTKRRVNLLLGPYTSRDVVAAASVAAQYHVLMVQAGGAASRIFSSGNRYVFGTLPVADEYFRSTIEMLKRLSPEAKTVGLIVGDDPFDIAVANGTRSLLEQAGLEVVLHQQYSERVPNFFNILTLVKARAPDVILWSGHESGAINFIRQSKGRNINPNLLWSFTTAVPTANFRLALGKDANYVFGMTPWLPSPRHKDRWFGDASQFAQAYEKRFGYAPDYHAAAAVAAVETLAMGMEAARTFESDYVRDAIAKLDFESIYGRIRFAENGQIVMPQTVIQIQNEQIVEIFTDQLINQPLYPVPPWDKRS